MGLTEQNLWHVSQPLHESLRLLSRIHPVNFALVPLSPQVCRSPWRVSGIQAWQRCIVSALIFRRVGCPSVNMGDSTMIYVSLDVVSALQRLCGYFPCVSQRLTLPSTLSGST